MLIVVSDTGARPDEPATVNELFRHGLDFFHLRKPGQPASVQLAFMADIDPAFRAQVVLHQHHDLAEDVGTRRLHDTTVSRLERKRFDAAFFYSTSVHSSAEYDSLAPAYAYTFVSPVFPSISKPGYFSPETLDPASFHSGGPTPVALGGLRATNCLEAASRGFKAIAVLGAVWHARDPLDSFLTIRDTWKSQDHSC